jgi:hypothetical protein
VANFTPFINHQSFDSEQVKAMGDIYDLITKTFPKDDHEAVALAVLAAVRTGEKDRDELCNLALLHLSSDEPKYESEQQREV